MLVLDSIRLGVRAWACLESGSFIMVLARALMGFCGLREIGLGNFPELPSTSDGFKVLVLIAIITKGNGWVKSNGLSTSLNTLNLIPE